MRVCDRAVLGTMRIIHKCCIDAVSDWKLLFANNLEIIDHGHEIGKEGVTGVLVSKPIVF